MNIIFDLDGTIVDSAPFIIECFREVLLRAGKLEGARLDHSLIGPPLRESMARLSGSGTPSDIAILVDEFRSLYDAKVTTRTPAYTGMAHLLASLKEAGLVLHIATNKRRLPTMEILENLGFLKFFDKIYTIDHAIPAYTRKAEMIAALLADGGIDPVSSAYVGDKREDGEAADCNDLLFFAVSWGYGDWEKHTPKAHWHLTSSPDLLERALLQAQH